MGRASAIALLSGAAAALTPSCGARSDLPFRPGPIDSSLVAACAKWFSCGAPTGNDAFLSIDPPPSTSACVFSNLYFPSFLVTGFLHGTPVSCINAAPSCDGVRLCVRGPVLCVGGGTSGACDATGRYASRCAFGASEYDDCAEAGVVRDPGATCAAGTDGLSRCSFGACSKGAFAPCDGDVMQSCDDGLISRWTCPFGSACVPGKDGATCTTGGAACDQDRCGSDGSVVACFKGKELRIPCASRAIQGVCRDSDAGTPTCVPAPELACDPMTNVDACDGTELVYCAGELRRIDCAALGFSGCSEAGGQARCVE